MTTPLNQVVSGGGGLPSQQTTTQRKTDNTRPDPKTVDKTGLEFPKPTWDEIEASVKGEVEVAYDYRQRKAYRRMQAWDRYYGKPLGTEVKGRSKFVTRETLDTIEWMMPYFIRTFASGDPKVKYTLVGQPYWTGDALMAKIQQELSQAEPSLFDLMYTWFKEALVTDTAFVKLTYKVDREPIDVNYEWLYDEHVQYLLQDPDAEIQEAGSVKMTEDGTLMYTDVDVRFYQEIYEGVLIENIPHWEFLVVPQSRSMNDEWGKGHITRMTYDQLNRVDRAYKLANDNKSFFYRMVEAAKSSPMDYYGETKEGARGDRHPHYMIGTGGEYYSQHDRLVTEEGARTPIDVIEWYTRLDIDGDGFTEPIVAWLGNNVLMRWEINEDDLIGMCALKPIIDCHKFFGISYADLIIEIQNLKTVLLRRILDNFDFQNSGRWRVDPGGGGVDIKSLLKNAPGSIVFARKDAVDDLTPQPFNPHSGLSMLEYIERMRENRTGVNRFLQGQDMNSSVSKTASGVMTLHNSAMQRMELIARIFAETGLKDFYLKIAELYKRNLRKPFTIRVSGVDRTVTPQMLQTKIIAKIDMGVESEIGMQESMKLERLMGILFDMSRQYPGLMPPEKLHNLASRYINALGWRQVEDFINDMDAFQQEFQQAQQSAQQQQEMMVAFEQKLRQMELDLKGKEIMTQAEIDYMKVQQKQSADEMRTLQNEKESMREYEVGLIKAMGDAAKARAAYMTAQKAPLNLPQGARKQE